MMPVQIDIQCKSIIIFYFLWFGQMSRVRKESKYPILPELSNL